MLDREIKNMSAEFTEILVSRCIQTLHTHLTSNSMPGHSSDGEVFIYSFESTDRVLQGDDNESQFSLEDEELTTMSWVR